MRSALVNIVLLSILLSYNPLVSARTAISIASGHGTKQVQAYRINYQKEWGGNSTTPNGRRINGYWEWAFSHMYSKKKFTVKTNMQLNAVTLAAVLRLHGKMLLPVFLDLGIGGAYLSKQEIATRNLGRNLLFEERLGIGLLFGARRQFEISYRVTHFSNAYLSQFNHGLNLHLLTIGYWFN